MRQYNCSFCLSRASAHTHTHTFMHSIALVASLLHSRMPRDTGTRRAEAEQEMKSGGQALGAQFQHTRRHNKGVTPDNEQSTVCPCAGASTFKTSTLIIKIGPFTFLLRILQQEWYSKLGNGAVRRLKFSLHWHNHLRNSKAVTLNH